MTQLVVLVVLAAWLAVLIPPMLRSRVENRPNSSVTDFRRQLDKLQHTSGPRTPARAMGRPLAPSGLGRSQRSVRAPDRPVLRSGVTTPQRVDGRPVDLEPVAPETDPWQPQPREAAPIGSRTRSHGDPTGGERRPAGRMVHDVPERRPATARSDRPAPTRREHTAPHGLARPVASAKRRRANVLFLLVAVTACTLFLAATTGSSVMFYGFALSFLALIGYVYLLAQLNQRSSAGFDGWLERY
ncbi:MAG: hypothetical protein AAGG08_12400 [Actinomycetota bacterium]